jgi:hypothetical protein
MLFNLLDRFRASPQIAASESLNNPPCVGTDS